MADTPHPRIQRQTCGESARYEVTLVNDDGCVAAARHFVGDRLTDRRWEAVVDDVLLATSELAAAGC